MNTLPSCSFSFNQVLTALFAFAPCYYTTDEIKLAWYETLYSLLLCQVNCQFLSCCGISAFALLLAHYIFMAQNPNAGVVKDLKEGEMHIGYNVDPNIIALDLSPYGRMYQDLIARTTVGSTVTNLPVVLGGVIQNMPVQCGCGYGWGGWGFGNAGFGGFGGGCGC